MKTTRRATLAGSIRATMALVATAILSPAISRGQEAEGAALESWRLQVEARVMERQAAVCAEGSPGYRARFDAAYRDWRKRNRRQLREGETWLRAESEQAGLDHEARMADLVDPHALYLAGADEAQRARVCVEILQRVGRGRER